MKSKKVNKQNQELAQMGDATRQGKMRKKKVKYNHKSHWLQQDDFDDLELPNYKDQEE